MLGLIKLAVYAVSCYAIALSFGTGTGILFALGFLGLGFLSIAKRVAPAIQPPIELVRERYEQYKKARIYAPAEFTDVTIQYAKFLDEHPTAPALDFHSPVELLDLYAKFYRKVLEKHPDERLAEVIHHYNIALGILEGSNHDH